MAGQTSPPTIRTGNYSVPLPGQGEYGLAPWEYTLGDLFSAARQAEEIDTSTGHIGFRCAIRQSGSKGP